MSLAPLSTQRLRNVLLPPGRQTLAADQIAHIATARAWIVGIALAIDVVLWFGLDVEGIRSDVRRGVLGFNLAALLVDLAISLGRLRKRQAGHEVVQGAMVVIEVVTSLVWVQATGIVSSYFLVMPILIGFFYRIGVGYWSGLLATTTACVGHLALFGGEELGLVRSTSLFDDAFAAGLVPRAVLTYRWMAMLSIGSLYWMTFVIGCAIAVVLREREVALRNARVELVRLAGDVKQGRLSGSVLDGKYELGDVLGRGGMGEVYQARRLSDDRQLAVKVLHPHLLGDDTLIMRFRREAEAVARLPPCHAPAVHDAGTTREGQHYLAMELLEGEDLGARLRRQGRLEPGEVVSIIEAITLSVGAAHDAGIIHRDLKPPNVFLTTDGAVRLLDFGVARLVLSAEDLTLTTSVLGSPGYLAPEQVSSGDVTPATDVFALAAIAYRALTGQNAFPSRNPTVAIFEALHHHPPPPSRCAPGLPVEVDLVIALGLAKPAEQRYADAREFARDLRSAIDGHLPDSIRARAHEIAPAGAGATMTAITSPG